MKTFLVIGASLQLLVILFSKKVLKWFRTMGGEKTGENPQPCGEVSHTENVRRQDQNPELFIDVVTSKCFNHYITRVPWAFDEELQSFWHLCSGWWELTVWNWFKTCTTTTIVWIVFLWFLLILKKFSSSWFFTAHPHSLIQDGRPLLCPLDSDRAMMSFWAVKLIKTNKHLSFFLRS